MKGLGRSGLDNWMAFESIFCVGVKVREAFRGELGMVFVFVRREIETTVTEAESIYLMRPIYLNLNPSLES